MGAERLIKRARKLAAANGKVDPVKLTPTDRQLLNRIGLKVKEVQAQAAKTGITIDFLSALSHVIGYLGKDTRLTWKATGGQGDCSECGANVEKLFSGTGTMAADDAPVTATDVCGSCAQDLENMASGKATKKDEGQVAL